MGVNSVAKRSGSWICFGGRKRSWHRRHLGTDGALAGNTRPVSGAGHCWPRAEEARAGAAEGRPLVFD